MGCQASIEEDVGWWEVSQDLLETRISRALLVLTEHLPTDAPGLYSLRGGMRRLERIQPRKEKPGWGGMSHHVVQRASCEGKPLTSGRSEILLRP